MNRRTLILVVLALVALAALSTLVFLATRGEEPGLETPPDADVAEVESAAPPELPAEPVRATQPPDLPYGAYQRYRFLEAFELALPLAEEGIREAQTLLGMLYDEGFGVPQDLVEAAGWFELAALAGDPEAQLLLGLAYLDGRGVAADRERAAVNFEAAAAQGVAEAQYNIGLFHLEANGVREQDFTTAARYFSEAAGQGVPEAQYALAQLYIAGEGVIRSEEIANRWLERAAEAGLIDAQIELGTRLFNGVGFVEPDEAAAAVWFRRAALAGNPVGEVRYAQLVAAGAGVPQDNVEAARLYLLARQAGLNDTWLEDFFNTLTEEEKEAARTAARQI